MLQKMIFFLFLSFFISCGAITSFAVAEEEVAQDGGLIKRVSWLSEDQVSSLSDQLQGSLQNLRDSDDLGNLEGIGEKFVSYWAKVGDPGNQADEVTHSGSVNNTFWMSKEEVTAEQYRDFLNAVAVHGDLHHLYDPQMENDSAVATLHQEVLEDGSYYYDLIDEGCADLPIAYVSFDSAKRYCNWMAAGMPSRAIIEELGEEGADQITETGSYDFTEGNGGVMLPDAMITLPTKNQWVKAAYYDPRKKRYTLYPFGKNTAPGNQLGVDGGLPNQANWKTATFFGDSFTQKMPPFITPVGAFEATTSLYGVYDMGGNVAEWIDEVPDQDGKILALGGSWQSEYHYLGKNDLMRTASRANQYYEADRGYSTVGFRVVALDDNSHDVPQREGGEFKVDKTLPMLGAKNSQQHTSIYFWAWFWFLAFLVLLLIFCFPMIIAFGAAIESIFSMALAAGEIAGEEGFFGVLDHAWSSVERSITTFCCYSYRVIERLISRYFF